MTREEILFFARELFASLRELNKRIDELQWIIKGDLYREDKKQEIIDRIKRLIETKFCLISSIYDIRIKLIECFSYDVAEYEEIKEAFKIDGLYNRLNGR